MSKYFLCVCACSFSGPELNLPPQAFVDVLPQLKVWYILLRFFFCPLLWRDRNPSEGKIKHDCYPGPTSESVQKFQISCKSEWALRSLVHSQIFYIFFFFLCVIYNFFLSLLRPTFTSLHLEIYISFILMIFFFFCQCQMYLRSVSLHNCWIFPDANIKRWSRMNAFTLRYRFFKARISTLLNPSLWSLFTKPTEDKSS